MKGWFFGESISPFWNKISKDVSWKVLVIYSPPFSNLFILFHNFKNPQTKSGNKEILTQVLEVYTYKIYANTIFVSCIFLNPEFVI